MPMRRRFSISPPVITSAVGELPQKLDAELFAGFLVDHSAVANFPTRPR